MRNLLAFIWFSPMIAVHRGGHASRPEAVHTWFPPFKHGWRQARFPAKRGRAEAPRRGLLL